MFLRFSGGGPGLGGVGAGLEREERRRRRRGCEQLPHHPGLQGAVHSQKPIIPSSPPFSRHAHASMFQDEGGFFSEI